jgi:nucleoside-diphosphate-sugar epimerase
LTCLEIGANHQTAEGDALILITGGAGRLGFEVVKRLLAEGEEVRVFDLPNINWSTIEALGGVNTRKGDITNSIDVSETCEGIEMIIHLAALMPPKSENNYETTHKVNVEGTRNLVKASKPGTPIVFASSISVYGITTEEKPPIDEEHKLIAHDIYSRTKISGEKLISESTNPHTILRISPITIADLVELPLTIPYSRDQRVEFVYVEDAAHAIMSALELVEERETFNVAGGATWQMLGHQYIESFYEALGADVTPKYSEANTAVDWYDTRKGMRLNYQRTTFDELKKKLNLIGEEYGLR